VLKGFATFRTLERISDLSRGIQRLKALNLESSHQAKNGAYLKSHTSKNYKPSTMFFAIFIYVAIIALLIAAQWKVYTKANKPGWACLIPIYNIIVLLEIIGKPWWWILMFLVPVANIIFSIWMVNLLAKSFGKTEGFTVGLVLLPVVFYPILGFGDATYNGPAGAN